LARTAQTVRVLFGNRPAARLNRYSVRQAILSRRISSRASAYGEGGFSPRPPSPIAQRKRPSCAVAGIELEIKDPTMSWKSFALWAGTLAALKWQKLKRVLRRSALCLLERA